MAYIISKLDAIGRRLIFSLYIRDLSINMPRNMGTKTGAGYGIETVS